MGDSSDQGRRGTGIVELLVAYKKRQIAVSVGRASATDVGNNVQVLVNGVVLILI